MNVTTADVTTADVTTADVTTRVTTTEARPTPTRPLPRPRRSVRRRRYLSNAAALVLAAVLLVWTLAPIYNMVLIAVKDSGDVFSDHIWPAHPSLESFGVVLTEGHWYLQNFWHQFGNSIYIAAMTTILTLLIGSWTSFSIGRMRIPHGWLLSNTALLTYVIPASFLAIPFYRIMQNYGLADNPLSVIAAEVVFATPYAIIVFQEYGRSIPIELDESARLDGASPLQLYTRVYLPLMAPALVAIGTYALLLAWNEYLYQFLLLSSDQSMTVPVALARFLNSDVAPWNYMMATAIIYALPPVAIYYVFRGRMRAGLTMGGVKG
jgi:multiple sugar transport system permease protein